MRNIQPKQLSIIVTIWKSKCLVRKSNILLQNICSYIVFKALINSTYEKNGLLNDGNLLASFPLLPTTIVSTAKSFNGYLLCIFSVSFHKRRRRAISFRSGEGYMGGHSVDIGPEDLIVLRGLDGLGVLWQQRGALSLWQPCHAAIIIFACVIALEFGGPHQPNNLLASCLVCTFGKSTLILIEYQNIKLSYYYSIYIIFNEKQCLQFNPHRAIYTICIQSTNMTKKKRFYIEIK